MQTKIFALVSAFLAIASSIAASPVAVPDPAPVPQTCPPDCWAQYWQCVANNIPEPTCRVQLSTSCSVLPGCCVFVGILTRLCNYVDECQKGIC